MEDNANTSVEGVLLSSESSIKRDEVPFTIKEEPQDIVLPFKNENNEEFENFNLNKKDVINDLLLKVEHNTVNEDNFTLCRNTVKNENCIDIVDIKREDTCNQDVEATESHDGQHIEEQLKSELPIITKELVVKLTRCKREDTCNQDVEATESHDGLRIEEQLKSELPIITKKLVVKLTRCILAENIKEEDIVGKNIYNIISENVSRNFDAPDAAGGDCENSMNVIPGVECRVKHNKIIQSVWEENRNFKCSICSISFDEKSNLKDHILSHSEEMFITQADNVGTFIDNNYSNNLRKNIDIEYLYCNICKKSCKTKWSFISHLELHNTRKNFVCNVCNKSFARHRDLKQHLPLHVRGVAEYVVKKNKLVRRVLGRYKCDTCGIKKGDRQMLAVHMLSHTQEMLLTKADNIQSWMQNNLPKDMIQYIDRDNRTCYRCNKTFGSNEAFVSHLLLHSNIKKYMCNICQKSFTSKPFLFVHLASHSNVNKFKCDICHKSFKSKGYIRNHLDFYCKKKEYVCKFCNCSFEKEAELLQHDKFSHNYSTPFLVKNRFHNSLNSEDKKYICGICDKQAISKDHIRMHLKIHDKSKTYFCSFCQKSFTSKVNISRHLVTHSDIKKYVCTVCGKMFKRSNELKSHSLIHSNDKTFLCNVCNKTFKHRHSLKNHFLIHKGTKNHKCTTCGKLFRQKAHLSTHLLTHKNIKNYSCSICSRLFTHNCSLKKHLLVHYNIKNFTCDICKKLFSQKGHLTSHLARIHNIKI